MQTTCCSPSQKSLLYRKAWKGSPDRDLPTTCCFTFRFIPMPNGGRFSPAVMLRSGLSFQNQPSRWRAL